MLEQNIKSNKIIPANNNQSPHYNWFLTFSYMLAPNDPEMQSAIFHYRLLRYVLNSPLRASEFFNAEENKETARLFRKAIMRKNLKNEIAERKKKVRRLGEMVRFLSLMHIMNTPDPSFNKAAYLSRVGFEKRDNERVKMKKSTFAYSKKQYREEKKKYNDVLHLCAAYSTVDPDRKKIKGSKAKKIKIFFSKTPIFHKFLTAFEFARQANKVNNRGAYNPFLKDSLYNFPKEFEYDKEVVQIEPVKFINKMNKYLPNYTSDWEEKLVKRRKKK